MLNNDFGPKGMIGVAQNKLGTISRAAKGMPLARNTLRDMTIGTLMVLSALAVTPSVKKAVYESINQFASAEPTNTLTVENGFKGPSRSGPGTITVSRSGPAPV